MRCTVKIEDLVTIDEIEGAWSDKDFIELLDRMNFPDAEQNDPSELEELLFMAINDFEPHEAAEIVLQYKLSAYLGKGQIKNLAVEMIDEKVAEEYAEISLHHPLFNVNQLLHKAFNGTFPSTKASMIRLKIEFHQVRPVEVSKEIVLKALSNGLSDRNLIKRLFADQLSGKAAFPEADHILWKMEPAENGSLSIITSDYWINEEDVLHNEFEGLIHDFESRDDNL